MASNSNILAWRIPWTEEPVRLQSIGSQELDTIYLVNHHHTVKGFSIGNGAEVGVFLEFSSFICDPRDVGDLLSGLSGFSKSSLNI